MMNFFHFLQIDNNPVYNTLYLLIPRPCFFIVLKRDLFVYRDGSLTS